MADEDLQYDRLLGVQTIQAAFSGIKTTLQLPSNINLGPKVVNGIKSEDYVNFFLLNFNSYNNEFIECGVSYSQKDGADGHWRVFTNTGAWPYQSATGNKIPDDPGTHNFPLYWTSLPITDSRVGLNFGFGSTITMELTFSASSTTFKVSANGNTYTRVVPNFQPQSTSSRVAYTMGCKDQFGYVSHNTATFSNVQLYNTSGGGWDTWGSNWGYADYEKRRDGKYGIYTRNPLSAYKTI